MLSEAEVETFRASGPGGQKRDSTESAVRLTHPEFDLTVTCSKTRSQQKNRRLALRKLRNKYALEIRHDFDPERLKFPESLREYRSNGLRVARDNPHFPFVLKLVLDLLAACDGRVGSAADHLGVSTNRVVEFLKSSPEALERANEIRARCGQHDLK